MDNATKKLISDLEYSGAPAYLTPERFQETPTYAHVFRKAVRECNLVGVYTLRRFWDDSEKTAVPVVFICEARDRAEADTIHKKVWNQNVVPFVIVCTPHEYRLYSGFIYDTENDGDDSEKTKKTLRRTVEALEIAQRFKSSHIDNGSIWRNEPDYVKPQARADVRLLQNLENLGKALREEDKLAAPAAHALIGKYVYLRYLRDRRILSDERLAQFGIEERDVFSRHAQIEKVRSLVECVDDWLNGSVFDIPWDDGIEERHIRRVAAAFFGDDAQSGQLCLFRIFDFSYVPIETLSVVYEQFLHAEGTGREKGAYYTPVVLADFLLNALEELLPLETGMRVLDPACGSGVFLVQCYRRLIELEYARKNGSLKPTELRTLLRQHIFGIDRDEDACKVTQLSLILTLLDYVEPPDLRGTSFKLPNLQGVNIFGGAQEDFFNLESKFHKCASGKPFHWIAGNPPWIELNKENRPKNSYVQQWMDAHKKECPAGGNQVAELFAWKVEKHLDDSGVAGLLMPAMTLFKKESKTFRSRFFARCRVESVVNFANMAYVLFAGRSESPCASFCFRKRKNEGSIEENEKIVTFSPFVLEQEANRPRQYKRKPDTWTISINANGIREVSIDDALSGDFLPWKLAMWGSYRDMNFLSRVASEFPPLKELRIDDFIISEGPQLRHQSAKELLEYIPELIGKLELNDLSLFNSVDHSFVIPPDAFEKIPNERAFVRFGRAHHTILICRPPHILLSSTRHYAIFSNEFFVVPPRQIGISCSPEKKDLLKAISLYLNSKFVRYHQFLCAPQWGIRYSISDLDTLKNLPVPEALFHEKTMNALAQMHSQLVVLDTFQESAEDMFSGDNRDRKARILNELNELVYDILGISHSERILVEDFVDVRVSANKGKVSPISAGKPEERTLKQYAKTLTEELDSFFDGDASHHKVTIVLDNREQVGLVEIAYRCESGAESPRLITADSEISGDMRRIRELVRTKYGQWLYFDRNFRIYEEDRIYIFKPLQNIHWLRSQALLDADTILSEIVSQGEQHWD